MSDRIGKTATSIWRHEYKKNGGTLSFPQWIEREKNKFAADGNNNLLLIDKTLNDSVHAAINDATGVNKKSSEKTVFGINKTIFIISAIVFVGGLTYLITRILKK